MLISPKNNKDASRLLELLELHQLVHPHFELLGKILVSQLSRVAPLPNPCDNYV